jgi:predicted oxidoreductase
LDQLNFIYIEALHEIIKSGKAKIKGKDYLLDLILKLIKKDSKKKVLLKNIQFHLVSSKFLQEFLEKFHFDGFDFDLFEQLKFSFQHSKESDEKLFLEQVMHEEENQKITEGKNKISNEKNNLENEKLYFQRELNCFKELNL